MIRPPALLCLIAIGLAPAGARAQAPNSLTWYRGNLHVHTDRSDGDSPPSAVLGWYRDHGYHFVAITDHNLLTGPGDSVPGGLLILGGIEVTDRVDRRPVHLNGIGVREVVLPQGGRDVPGVVENNAGAIRRAGGIPILNHPNGLLTGHLTSTEIRRATSVSLFEVCCADYRGGSGVPSTDELWDALLSAGHRALAVAADDAHAFRGEARQAGTAWVMVQAPRLTREAILESLAAGRFYATTGVEIPAISRHGDTLALQLPPADGFGYRTHFLGSGGRVLAVDESRAPRYRLARNDPYVRARVERSDGATAWIQPLFRTR